MAAPKGGCLYERVLCFQAARSGLDKCQQKAGSAASEADKAEAQVGVELYEALVKALE